MSKKTSDFPLWDVIVDIVVVLFQGISDFKNPSRRSRGGMAKGLKSSYCLFCYIVF